ncbi:hypothetical protein CLAFUW4_02123 [Fulvia fulva]|uniref:Uncharacterized protein n=1 Tax=Passalora fulva TaxID=5499 RepID=A0A9Q8L4T7_PASFU|nr:uncharacterized protein CLAFUR5_02116 [Fulvia fulva]KAK4634970.1 hypothetical protein CLAFUR4_02119 [Fulvia fulva]KAK4638218.1 hypothetical protein CLAFUR0_02122 [Fulvia fulva]UJO10885.1 hypothetical protein CLAFUR5_02116 [Fulvia fulva]WPV09870.1 hypothetical protein CLAFUW4_02123 [Fulvia fulva]WPV24898.1 hypothetical protein CLAFUW7_02123 [Fulvia fulva]
MSLWTEYIGATQHECAVEEQHKQTRSTAVDESLLGPHLSSQDRRIAFQLPGKAEMLFAVSHPPDVDSRYGPDLMKRRSEKSPSGNAVLHTFQARTPASTMFPATGTDGCTPQYVSDHTMPSLKSLDRFSAHDSSPTGNYVCN